MFKFTLCGVEIRRFVAPKKNIRFALIDLDIKIREFEDKANNSRYANSSRAMIELSEIIGEIKFMYSAAIITPAEYQDICNNIASESFNSVEEV